MPKFEVSKEVADQTFEAVEISTNTGKIRRGVNEVTKAVEREKAMLVVIAGDVSPEEIVMHLPILCDEKNIAYTYVPTKKELGAASGIPVGTSAIAIVETGDAKDLVDGLKKKVAELKK
ncbi:50S ribosomal protein L7Ae [archaeon]